jgi:hypothetical protein
VFFRRLCKYEGAQMGCKEDNEMIVRILGNHKLPFRLTLRGDQRSAENGRLSLPPESNRH